MRNITEQAGSEQSDVEIIRELVQLLGRIGESDHTLGGLNPYATDVIEKANRRLVRGA